MCLITAVVFAVSAPVPAADMWTMARYKNVSLRLWIPGVDSSSERSISPRDRTPVEAIVEKKAFYISGPRQSLCGQRR
jgi:hypothetical protein